MHHHLTCQFPKALIPGFFCCLGASAKDAGQKMPEPLPFALRQVHPNSEALVEASRITKDLNQTAKNNFQDPSQS